MLFQQLGRMTARCLGSNMPKRRQNIEKDIKVVIGSTKWCHICGLPIPREIVDPHHPLAWTADHVIPISRKGQNRWYNRRSAHRACNQVKADRMGLLFEEAERRREIVAKHLERLGFPVLNKVLVAARKRASAPKLEPSKAK